jgi:hypothetical protein
MTAKTFFGACIIVFTTFTGTVAASAHAGRHDAVQGGESILTMVGEDLNPQPLPPRCTPPRCKPSGGGAKARPMIRRRKPQH